MIVHLPSQDTPLKNKLVTSTDCPKKCVDAVLFDFKKNVIFTLESESGSAPARCPGSQTQVRLGEEDHDGSPHLERRATPRGAKRNCAHGRQTINF